MARKLKFAHSVTYDNEVGVDETRSAEQVLARLVANAYAADHPELFCDRRRNVNIMGSRLEGPRIRTGQGDEGAMTAGEIYARTE